jgi:hypothetical protein
MVRGLPKDKDQQKEFDDTVKALVRKYKISTNRAKSICEASWGREGAFMMADELREMGEI